MAAAPLYNPSAPIYSGEGISGDTPFAAGQGAAATGPSLTGQRVNVVAPNGETVSIDVAELPHAETQGFKVESAEARGIRKYVEENKGLPGAAKVALRGLLDEATFGVADVAIDANRDPYELAKWEALKADHTMANIAGRAGGFGVSLLYGGPVFDAASHVGSAAARLAGRELLEHAAGRAVTAELAYRGAAEGAKHVGPGVAKRVLQSMADFGGQGLALSTPKAMAQLMTGDPERAAETWMWGAAGGAALGAPFGLAGGVAGKVAAKAADPLVETSGLTGAAAAKLRKFGDEQAISALNYVQRFSKRLKQIKGGPEEAARIFREHDLGRYAGETTEMAAAVQEVRSTVGGKIGAIYDAAGPEKLVSIAEIEKAAMRPVQEAFNTPGQVGASETVGAWIKKEILGPLSPNAAATEASTPAPATWREFIKERMGPYMKSEGSHGAAIKKIAEEWRAVKSGAVPDALALAGEEAAPVGLTLSELHKLRQVVDKATKWDSTVSNEVNELRKGVRDALTGMIETKLDRAGREMGRELNQELRALNKQYSVLRVMADGAEHNVVRQMSNSRHGLFGFIGNQVGSTVGGFVGGGVGSLLGGAAGGEVTNALRRYAPSYLSQGAHGIANALEGRGLVALEGAFANNAKQLDRIPVALETLAAGKRALRPAARETLGVNVLTRFLGADQKLDTVDDVMAYSDRLASLASDPARATELAAEATEAIRTDAPDVAVAAAQKLAQAAMYLHEKAPKPPTLPGPFEPPSRWRPDAVAVRDFKARVAVAKDPYVAIDALQDGTLTRAHVETLQALAPKLYDEMIKRVMDYGASGKAKPLPYAERLRLSMLTGAPLDRSLAQIAGYQQAFASPHATEETRSAAKMRAPEMNDVQRLTG